MPSTARDLLVTLHRATGNQAVQRMIRAERVPPGLISHLQRRLGNQAVGRLARGGAPAVPEIASGPRVIVQRMTLTEYKALVTDAEGIVSNDEIDNAIRAIGKGVEQTSVVEVLDFLEVAAAPAALEKLTSILEHGVLKPSEREKSQVKSSSSSDVHGGSKEQVKDVNYVNVIRITESSDIPALAKAAVSLEVHGAINVVLEMSNDPLPMPEVAPLTESEEEQVRSLPEGDQESMRRALAGTSKAYRDPFVLDILSSRAHDSVLIIADLTDLRLQQAELEKLATGGAVAETVIAHSIRPDQYYKVLLPARFQPFVKENPRYVFVGSVKDFPATYYREGVGTHPAQIDAPDYESALVKIFAEKKGHTLIAHAARLATTEGLAEYLEAMKT